MSNFTNVTKVDATGAACGLAVGTVYYAATAVGVAVVGTVLVKAAASAFAIGKIAAGTVYLAGGAVSAGSAIRRSILAVRAASFAVQEYNDAKSLK